MAFASIGINQNTHTMKWINLLGLLLDIAGAVLMFTRTPYPTQNPNAHISKGILAMSGGWIMGGKAQEKKNKRLTKIGFWIMIAGFILQFIASAF